MFTNSYFYNKIFEVRNWDLKSLNASNVENSTSIKDKDISYYISEWKFHLTSQFYKVELGLKFTF